MNTEQYNEQYRKKFNEKILPTLETVINNRGYFIINANLSSLIGVDYWTTEVEKLGYVITKSDSDYVIVKQLGDYQKYKYFEVLDRLELRDKWKQEWLARKAEGK